MSDFKHFTTRSVVACFVMLAGCRTIPDLSERVGSFQIVDGNQQTVQAGKPADTPLTVRALNDPREPLEGLDVRWTIASGGGTLSTSTSVTDNTGTATVIYTASAQTGPVIIRATVPPDLTVTFNLTVVAPGS